MWRVTPLFAEWISSPRNLLFGCRLLAPSSAVLELGCGVSGIVSLTLAPRVRSYIATDQEYVLKMLRKNIDENTRPATVEKSRDSKKSNRKAKTPSREVHDTNTTNIDAVVLDWELHSASGLSGLLESKGHDGVDAVIACDCIYNEALIGPFVDTCADVCRLRAATETLKPTVCVVAQQLRSSDVFGAWLEQFHRQFRVWRVPESLMLDVFGPDSGFVIHVGILRLP